MIFSNKGPKLHACLPLDSPHILPCLLLNQWISENRYNIPVPGCFKEFSATYYHICNNIYAIKSFILNNPICMSFFVWKKLTTELGLTCSRYTLTSLWPCLHLCLVIKSRCGVNHFNGKILISIARFQKHPDGHKIFCSILTHNFDISISHRELTLYTIHIHTLWLYAHEYLP